MTNNNPSTQMDCHCRRVIPHVTLRRPCRLCMFRRRLRELVCQLFFVDEGGRGRAALGIAINILSENGDGKRPRVTGCRYRRQSRPPALSRRRANRPHSGKAAEYSPVLSGEHSGRGRRTSRHGRFCRQWH